MRSSNLKKTLKFILCLIVVFAVLAGMDLALYPCTYMRNDMHTVTSEQKDIIILGTSNGKMGLVPELMLEGTGLTGHNLCSGNEYPIDDYYMLKLILEKQHPKQVVFEVDPAVFVTEKEKDNNYLLFFHEFPLSAAKLEYFADTMLDSDLRSMLFPFYEYSLQQTLPRVGSNLEQKLGRNYDVSYLKGSQQEYHEDGFIERYPVAAEDFPKTTPTLFSRDEVKQTNLDYLDKVIELCRENGVDIIATSMPQSDVMLNQYADNYEQAWDYFTDYFTSRNVKYYNFNREYYNAYPHTVDKYVDLNGHMNGDSAREFSKIFGDSIYVKTEE